LTLQNYKKIKQYTNSTKSKKRGENTRRVNLSSSTPITNLKKSYFCRLFFLGKRQKAIGNRQKATA
jgi:hypothetical protein